MSTYPQLPSDPEKPALGDTMMLDQVRGWISPRHCS